MKFEVETCVKYVEMLINHDEVERALLVLDNVPAYFRDHQPPELVKLREEILAARYTAHAYITSDFDTGVNEANAVPNFRNLLRCRLVEAEVKRYNEHGVTPHLIDMGPGPYLVPIALKQLGYQFTYWDIALNERAQRESTAVERTKTPPSGAPILFLANELIEHLSDPSEIAVEALRHAGRLPERIHLSTPCYTYDIAHDEWRTKGGLPHLRAYTPQEFFLEAQRILPGYSWELLLEPIMSLRGMRADVVDHKKLE